MRVFNCIEWQKTTLRPWIKEPCIRLAHKRNIWPSGCLTLIVTRFLQYVQIFAIFKFRVFLTEQPREHLSCLHTCFYHSSAFVPCEKIIWLVRKRSLSHLPLLLSRVLIVIEHFQSNLCQNTHQELVHVVIDSHGYFDKLGAGGARQTLSV